MLQRGMTGGGDNDWKAGTVVIIRFQQDGGAAIIFDGLFKPNNRICCSQSVPNFGL